MAQMMFVSYSDSVKKPRLATAMKFPILRSLSNLLAVSLLALTASHVQAASFQTTIGGTSYNFTTITGTYIDNQSQLSSQPWFGSDSLANTFATAVSSNLGGTVNFGELGPLFAYSLSGSNFDFAAYSFGNIVNTSFSRTDTYTFAVAQAQQVPEIDGAMIPQALMLMGASVLFLRRRNS